MTLPREPRRSALLSALSRRPFTRLHSPAERLRKVALRRKFAAALRRDSTLDLVYQYDRFWLSTRSTDITASRARRNNFLTATELLENASVPFFGVPDEAGRHARLGIEEEHWEEFATALEQSDQSPPIYLGVSVVTRLGTTRRAVVPIHSEAGRIALRHQDSIEVFQFHSDDRQHKRFGRAQACVIDRWQRTESGSLVTETRNPRTTVLGRNEQVVETLHIHEKDVPSYRPLLKRNVFEVREPIDVVYMWVDGQDQAWREKYDATVQQLTGEAPADSIDAARFRDNGELRYSLRSVDQHCEWVRNIILVTDSQIPDWLDVEHPRIRVVNHQELFGDAGRLPTFNSHAIASRIHHIEGLSERYLIFNDDVFVGRSLEPEQFFQSNGVAKFFLSKATLPYDLVDAPTHEIARMNVVKLLENKFGVTVTRAFYHTPLPQLRSLMFELEGAHPEVFEGTWSHQLRSSEDYEINGWLHHYYGYLTKRTMPASIRYDYFDLSDEAVVPRLSALLESRQPAVFCVNDNPGATDATLEFVGRWLAEYFPTPAPWELG